MGLSDDDPRHGTVAGYMAGCRSANCWRAKQRYDKRRRWEVRQGLVRKVPSLGSVRRIHALRCAGWSGPRIAAAAGLSSQVLYDIGRYPTISVRKHRIIAETYEALLAVDPPVLTKSDKHARTKSKAYARRLGLIPAERWLDIDDPDEKPDTGYSEYRPHHELDIVVVERILAGDWALSRTATVAERNAVVDFWTGTKNDLERLTGWNVARYGKAA